MSLFLNQQQKILIKRRVRGRGKWGGGELGDQTVINQAVLWGLDGRGFTVFLDDDDNFHPAPGAGRV